jgi:hypothetical protein
MAELDGRLAHASGALSSGKQDLVSLLFAFAHSACLSSLAQRSGPWLPLSIPLARPGAGQWRGPEGRTIPTHDGVCSLFDGIHGGVLYARLHEWMRCERSRHTHRDAANRELPKGPQSPCARHAGTRGIVQARARQTPLRIASGQHGRPTADYSRLSKGYAEYAILLPLCWPTVVS